MTGCYSLHDEHGISLIHEDITNTIIIIDTLTDLADFSEALPMMHHLLFVTLLKSITHTVAS